LLIACQKAGLIAAINDRAMDWRSPAFWAELLRVLAYREGLGDAWLRWVGCRANPPSG